MRFDYVGNDGGTISIERVGSAGSILITIASDTVFGDYAAITLDDLDVLDIIKSLERLLRGDGDA